MRYRKYGKTGWNVSEIGYGMWGMGGWGGGGAVGCSRLRTEVPLPGTPLMLPILHHVEIGLCHVAGRDNGRRSQGLPQIGQSTIGSILVWQYTA